MKIKGKLIYSPYYFFKLENHVYRPEKYGLVKEKLIREGYADEDDFLEPDLPDEELLLLVHEKEYLDDLMNLRQTPRTMHSELPLNRETVNSALYSCSGTILALNEALEHLVGAHLGGGHHHAYPDHAEGFCYLNDVAIAARFALNNFLARKVAIIDCDLHQGNGTAFIFQNEARVFTFSIHEEDIYPPKEKSSLDIGLKTGTGDQEYLQELEKGLRETFLFQPDLAIFVAGTDPFMHDRLGNLNLTKEGLLKRDQMVLEEAEKRGVSIVVTMAGGYAQQLEDTIELHCQTVREAIKRMK